MIDKKKATLRQRKYDKENTFRIPLKFNIKSDADIKERLEQIKELGSESVQGYIKRLIRTDIQRQKEKGLKFQKYMEVCQEEFSKKESPKKAEKNKKTKS